MTVTFVYWYGRIYFHFTVVTCILHQLSYNLRSWICLWIMIYLDITHLSLSPVSFTSYFSNIPLSSFSTDLKIRIHVCRNHSDYSNIHIEKCFIVFADYIPLQFIIIHKRTEGHSNMLRLKAICPILVFEKKNLQLEFEQTCLRSSSFRAACSTYYGLGQITEPLQLRNLQNSLTHLFVVKMK